MTAHGSIETYTALSRWILQLSSERPRLIAIDAPGGAGKSVFACRLSNALGEAPIVPTDDFATGEPGDEWWTRLERQVPIPLARGHAARYQRYDWESRSLAEEIEVAAAPSVIIEGVSSDRSEAARLLALAVRLYGPRQTRLLRGLTRDGEAARDTWARWMAEEDEHFRANRTIARCGLLVDGAPSLPHDPETEFVRLEDCVYE